jgi:hypothetical protein
MTVPTREQRLEAWLVILIAVHTYAVGMLLLFATGWGIRFGGWPEGTVLFFPRQAGVFHLLIGTAYLLEYFRRRSVTLLLIAKATALAFLMITTVAGGSDTPWAVPFSGIADGLMGLVVFAVHRVAERSIAR